MVNNQKARVHFSALLLLFSFSFVLSAQDISKHYSTQHQQNGVLYFIFPQEGFQNSSGTLIYDMTCMTTNDTVTFNFSVLMNEETILDKIIFSNSEKIISSKVSKLFVEFKKEKWLYRYTAKFIFNDLVMFFNEGTPTISLQSNDKIFSYSIKQKKWKHNYSIVKKIFSLINLNK